MTIHHAHPIFTVTWKQQEKLSFYAFWTNNHILTLSNSFPSLNFSSLEIEKHPQRKRIYLTSYVSFMEKLYMVVQLLGHEIS